MAVLEFFSHGLAPQLYGGDDCKAKYVLTDSKGCLGFYLETYLDLENSSQIFELNY